MNGHAAAKLDAAIAANRMEAWPEQEIVQRRIAQLPWRQNMALLEKRATPAERLAAPPTPTFEGRLPLLTHTAKLKGVGYGG